MMRARLLFTVGCHFLRKEGWKLLPTLAFSVLAVRACAAETATLRWHLGAPSRDRVQVETVELPGDGDRASFAWPKEKIPDGAWALDVIPSFMTAKVGDAGWWMNGRGVYGAFTRESGMNRWWRSQTPVFAVKRGDVAWSGRVNTYRFDYDLVVESVKGAYAVFPRFRFDRVREYFPLYADIDVSFRRYAGTDAGYVQIAKDYRASQFAAGVKPIKARVKEFPDLAYLSEAMVIRLQTHGAKPIPEKPTDYTKETEPPISVYMPFNVAEEFVEHVKAAGVEKAAFVSAGWNKGGYDGQLPEHFPVEPVLGGEKGLRRLIARTQELGFMLMLHATHTEVYTVCPWFSEDYIAKKSDGSRSWNGLYFGGSCYWICERASWEGWIPREMRRMRDLGVKGNHYVDVFSATYPNRCADPRHPATPEQMAAYQNKILAEAKRVFGGVSSEGGYDHVAANLDCINYVSTEMKKLHDGKTKGLELVDGVFPFWEIVYHGTILYNSDRFTQNHTRGQNHAKKDESGNLDWLEGDGIVDPRTTLKIAEFGGRPIFYTYKFKDIPAIKRAYDEFQPLKHLQTVLIDDHREVGPGLFVTRYENGEEVVCNYNASPCAYRGHPVPALGYRILNPPAARAKRPARVVFDTDMIGDYDDVGAMAVLHKLADAGECEILATVSSTHSNASVGTIEVLNRYYGRPDIPVGAVKGDGVGGGSENPLRRSHVKYEKLLKMYPGWWRHRNANTSPDATEVYRRVLATQPDGSVTVVTTGFLTNLRKLLESGPDAFSPLDGPSLVKAKVKALYVMGGKVPKGREFNLYNDPRSADAVFRRWPTELVVCDFWFGTYIYAGRKVAAAKAGNPVRDIYAMCLPPPDTCPPASEIIPTGRFMGNVREGHNCFDQACVLAAVRGPGSFFKLVPGRMQMVGDQGENVWTPDSRGPHAAMAFVAEWPRERIAAEIEHLMAAPPGKAQWVNLGSNTGLFGFDWQRAGVNGLNLAGSPQSLRRSLAKLKAHRRALADGAVVIFPICPFSAILPEAYDRTPSASTHPLLAFDGTPTTQDMIGSRDGLVKCWKDQFAIADFADPMTARNRAAYAKMVAFARAAIAWCRAEGLRPVFVYPPMATCFDGIFPESFEQAYIRDYLRDIGPDVPFLDYRNSPELRGDDNFANSLFLNRTGCAKLTARVIRDVRALYGDVPR